MLFHLGAGPGGLQEFCTRYRESFHRWWDDLGSVELSPEIADQLARGVNEEVGGKPVQESAAEARRADPRYSQEHTATAPLGAHSQSFPGVYSAA